MPEIATRVVGGVTMRDNAPTTIVVPVVMTAKEVAALLRVAISTVYKYKDCDGLPAHRFGGAVRFYQHEILDWMNRSEDQHSNLEG